MGLAAVSFETISRNVLLLTGDKAVCSGVSSPKGIQKIDDYETAHHPCVGYETGLCCDFTQADFPEITLLWATLPEASGQQLRAEVLE